MAALIVQEVATLLLKGLVSGIGSSIGGKIFNSVFKQSVPSYFTDVYKQIEKLVHQEISANTIAEIDGQINGIVEWVKNVYIPRKDSDVVSKEDLYELLLPQFNDNAIHMVAILEEERFATQALPVFIIGASVSLALMQELCLVDPSVSDPNHSSYVTSIEKYASTYAEHAEKIYTTLRDARTALISDIDMSTAGFPPSPVQPPPIPPGSFHQETKWSDSFTGKSFVDATDMLMGTGWTNGDTATMMERSKKEKRRLH